MKERAGAALQIAGVITFILAWSVLGSIRDGYSPIHDAISRLAELGAPHRELMTIGIVAFAAGAVAFAPVLGGRGGIALATAGMASFGVAFFPCTERCPGPGEATDTAHTLAAGIHYVALVAAPLLVSRERKALFVSVVAAIALGLHGIGVGPNGLLQRIGLTTLDIWIVSLALGYLRGANAERAPSAV
jgi:hypothetical protein